MFFDPTCKPETKADPFTLESLIAWLEKQPADGSYDYGDSGRCLAAQYLLPTGLDRSRFIGRAGPDLEEIIPGLWGIASGFFTAPHDRTFGDALKRARKALAQSGGY